MCPGVRGFPDEACARCSILCCDPVPRRNGTHKRAVAGLLGGIFRGEQVRGHRLHKKDDMAERTSRMVLRSECIDVRESGLPSAFAGPATGAGAHGDESAFTGASEKVLGSDRRHAEAAIDDARHCRSDPAGRQLHPGRPRHGQDGACHWTPGYPVPGTGRAVLGAAEDDMTAIREVERLRRVGAGFIVFAWPAFWWLEYYSKFHEYLRSRFPCVSTTERLVAFDLRG